MKQSELVFIHAKDGSAQPANDAILDVIFVHGLNGDLYQTWRCGNNDEMFWPRWLANDCPQINIWTAGFGSSLFAGFFSGEGASIEERSKMLLQLLLNQEIGSRGIVFITHSLGGLIVKEILRKCHESHNEKEMNLLDNIEGIAFIGTPHHGTRGAKTINSILRPILGKITKELAYGDPWLKGLSEWFQNWAGRDTISTIVCYETLNTMGHRIVDPSSANPGVPHHNTIPIDANHTDICKPTSRQSPIYRFIFTFVDKVKEVHLNRKDIDILKKESNYNKFYTLKTVEGFSVTNIYGDDHRDCLNFVGRNEKEEFYLLSHKDLYIITVEIWEINDNFYILNLEPNGDIILLFPSSWCNSLNNKEKITLPTNGGAIPISPLRGRRQIYGIFSSSPLPVPDDVNHNEPRVMQRSEVSNFIKALTGSRNTWSARRYDFLTS